MTVTSCAKCKHNQYKPRSNWRCLPLYHPPSSYLARRGQTSFSPHWQWPVLRELERRLRNNSCIHRERASTHHSDRECQSHSAWFLLGLAYHTAACQLSCLAGQASKNKGLNSHSVPEFRDCSKMLAMAVSQRLNAFVCRCLEPV